MKKQANWTNSLAGGAAIGGGTFAIGQLIQELLHQQAAQQEAKKREVPANSLVIDLPQGLTNSKMGAEETLLPESFIKEALSDLGNTMAMIGGAPIGFLGAKTVYDQWKKKQQEQEIAAANMKYLKALQTVGKTAEATPTLDSLCTGMAEALEKSAGPVDILKKLWHMPGEQKMMAGALGLGAAPALAYDYLSPAAAAPAGENMLGRAASNTFDALKVISALTALTTGGLMINSARNKEQKSKPKLPSAVAINYKNVDDGVGDNPVDNSQVNVDPTIA